MTDAPARCRTFGPVVLLGLAAGALGAVAGSNPWVVDPAGHAGDPVPGIEVADPVAAAGEVPLALALNLVLLAVWGVVLVTRGRLRRAVATLGLVTAAGLVVTVVVGLVAADDRVSEAIRERGLTDAIITDTSAWFYAAAVAALASLAASALAVAWAPTWPEMGRRYDAPGTAPAEPPPEERSNLDLWKSMDEGRDPTA